MNTKWVMFYHATAGDRLPNSNSALTISKRAVRPEHVVGLTEGVDRYIGHTWVSVQTSKHVEAKKASPYRATSTTLPCYLPSARTDHTRKAGCRHEQLQAACSLAPE